MGSKFFKKIYTFPFTVSLDDYFNLKPQIILIKSHNFSHIQGSSLILFINALSKT